MIVRVVPQGEPRWYWTIQLNVFKIVCFILCDSYHSKKTTLKENINGSVWTLFSSAQNPSVVPYYPQSKKESPGPYRHLQRPIQPSAPHPLGPSPWPHLLELSAPLPPLTRDYPSASPRTPGILPLHSPCGGFSLCLKRCDLDIHMAPSLTSFKPLLKGHLIVGMLSAYLTLLYSNFSQHIM